MQDFELTDAIYRSRKTVLDMMEARDYITTPYRNYSPKEITYMMGPLEGQGLRMDLSHKDGTRKCVVHYYLPKIKNKLRNYLEAMNDPENPNYLNPETTEVVIMVTEPVVDTFHQGVLENYMKHKSRVFIFQIQTLVNNPSQHVLVPKHEKVPAEEATELMKNWYIKSKSQFPIIRFHADMQARYHGLVPGDIIKIDRPSLSAGEYTLYRVCV
jgi:DNA-directed RNA polymerase subunit H (RpoH/RPB5)